VWDKTDLSRRAGVHKGEDTAWEAVRGKL
jgi:hypothetical protein